MLGTISTTVGFSDVLKQKSIPESVLESVSKSIPPTRIKSIAESIAEYLPLEESLGFLAWVQDAKPTTVELREIFAELLEDPTSDKSIMHGLQWVA